jgi:hypothetical protein
MIENKHVIPIPIGVILEVADHIRSALAALQPYVTPLTAAERHALLKMGDKALSFVEKSFDFATANPALTPPYVDMAAFAVDKSDATGLRSLQNSAQQLVEYIADTQMVAGSEAYKTSLVVYNAIKLLAAQDVPGAKAVYEELKKFFHKTRAKSQE